jgi:hypothetical protein
MSDIVSSGKWADHPCTHTRASDVFLELPSELGPYNIEITYSSGAKDVYEITYRPNGKMNYDLAFTLPTFEQLDPLTGELFYAAALRPAILTHVNKCRNILREELSILNFLLELKELKGIFTSIWEAFKNPNRFSDPALAYQFGIKPFLRDLNTIFNTFGTIYDGIQKIRGKGTVIRRVKTEWLVDYPGLGEIVHEPNSPIGPSLHRGDNDRSKITVNFMILSRVRYDCNEIDGLSASILSALRAFGLLNPVKVAWNAIPYSFVADWLFNVGQFLDFCDLSRAFIPSYVESSVWTLNQSMQETVFASCVVSPGVEIYRDLPVRVHSISRFDRGLSVPPVVLTISDLSFREQVLSVLLAVQRLGKRRYIFPRYRLPRKGKPRFGKRSRF